MRFFVPHRRPVFTIEDNKAQGPASALFTSTYFFILRSFNYSLIPFEVGPGSKCISLDCRIPMEALEEGKIDYYHHPSLLSTIHPNLTVGPMTDYTACRIWGRSTKRSQLISHDFIDIFNEISLEATLFILFVAIINALFLCVITRTSIMRVIMNMYALLFRESFGFRRLIKGPESKILATEIAIFCFFVETVFLCYIKTGMISDSGYTRVDSFEDILRLKLRPYIINYSFCNSMIKPEHDKVDRYLHERLNIIRIGQTRMKLAVSNHFVLIADPAVAYYYHTFWCIYIHDSVGNQYHYMSKPLRHAPNNAILSKHTPRLIRNRLKKVLYILSDQGFSFVQAKILGNFLQAFLATRPKQACINGLLQKSHDIPSSISIRFFQKLVLLYVIVVVLSFDLFALEFLII